MMRWSEEISDLYRRTVYKGQTALDGSESAETVISPKAKQPRVRKKRVKSEQMTLDCED